LLGVDGAAAVWMMYMTWPYLWDAPIARLMESMQFTAAFEGKSTLYRGGEASSRNLPWHYFPTLATIELTEPVVVLFVVGVAVAAWRWAKRKVDRAVLGMLALWLVIPLVALIGLGMGIYGNIRHLHFVLVPVMILAGIGMAWAMGRLRRIWVRYAVYTLVVLPGVIGIVQLHPYESVYFNSYVGGVRGAAGVYEMDRFCTSYREAMEFVNGVAPEGAVVLVPGSPGAASPFAREDLIVTGREQAADEADFLIRCRLAPHFEGMRLVHQVGRDTAIFAEIWQRAEP